MDFKKTTNSINNLDEFIDGAEIQKEKKQIKKDNKVSLGTKSSKEIAIKIRKKYSSYSLFKFIEIALTTQIPYIKDEAIVTIYEQAKWHNISMSEFVKFKMGLIEKPHPNEKKEIEHLRNYVIYVDKKKKEKICQIADNLGLSIMAYSEIKIKATYELRNIFKFEEIMQFKKDAKNYELDLDEYIEMKIKG